MGEYRHGLGNRLSVFQNSWVDKITKYNEIDLEPPGKRPCAYFCIISDSDSSLEFLSSLFFSTLFVRLTNYARRHGENGRLPMKVNICLDEFCNIGKILDFKKLISTVRSRGIRAIQSGHAAERHSLFAQGKELRRRRTQKVRRVENDAALHEKARRAVVGIGWIALSVK